MRKYILLLIAAIFLMACGSNEEVEKQEETEDVEEELEEEVVEEIDEVEDYDYDFDFELTEREQMIENILDLIDEGLAFDTGSYVKGDIPKGEYVFVTFDGSGSYYSEEDSSGNIIDNENFESFGYVEVHEAGNIQSDGALIGVDSLDDLDVTGAKELYEVLNEVEEYEDSGWYKVGIDIEPGEYTIESYGTGYVASMSGPVGNNSINQNENFEGRYSINLNEGDYLVVSRATIAE